MFNTTALDKEAKVAVVAGIIIFMAKSGILYALGGPKRSGSETRTFHNVYISTTG